jgi:hypothetical protein
MRFAASPDHYIERRDRSESRIRFLACSFGLAVVVEEVVGDDPPTIRRRRQSPELGIYVRSGHLACRF